MTRSLMLSVVVAAAVALQPARLRNAATTRLHAANIQYGDTGGAALVLDDLSVRRGPVELVSGATWTIMPGERWGIVGPNGAGKSTLLGAILGIHDMTTGHVAVKSSFCRSGLVSRSTRRICGSNPRSSMRSASSSTK